MIRLQILAGPTHNVFPCISRIVSWVKRRFSCCCLPSFYKGVRIVLWVLKPLISLYFLSTLLNQPASQLVFQLFPRWVATPFWNEGNKKLGKRLYHDHHHQQIASSSTLTLPFFTRSEFREKGWTENKRV